VGLNFNFTRTNATGTINANWGAWTFQNQGTLPIDWMLRTTGAVRTGLDLSALTFPDFTLVGISLSSGGNGYTAGDLLKPPDGTYDQQTAIKVLTVDGSGVILTFALDRAGLYSVAPASPSTVSGGSGTGASFTLQYSTSSSKPALITKTDNCWYGNVTQDNGVYATSYSSTLKLGTSWVCWSSSLGAWKFVAGNNSVLQLYNNQKSSDQRLKTDIQSLDASSSLSFINALNPVSYIRIDQPGEGSHLGFVAQDVQKIFPQLVSTTSPTALTPDGTLTLNYVGLIAPIVRAIQALATELASLKQTIAGFADSFTTKELTFTRATGDELTVKKLNTQQLCATKADGTAVCVTGDQLAAVFAGTNATASTPAPSSGSATPAPDTAPPTITINGTNPAIIHIGDSYADLGATITGPQADPNLGIRT
jgi:hypothetical protein